MMTFNTLHEVADLLPFHLDDTVHVNEAFARWTQRSDEADKRLVDTWTYCYIYRYFLVKFASTRAQHTLAFDQLVTKAFSDVQSNLDSVRRPECYTGWVSTICRNTFVNHLRTQRCTVALDDEWPMPLADQAAPAEVRDARVLHQSIRTAIEALPDFLRDVARLRLLENCSYKTIQEKTGRPLATLRAYVNKALEQLRGNPSLQALLEEMRDA